MNRLTAEKRAQVIASLVEGNSIRATVRMTGVAKNTVSKLLVDMGTVCSIYQDEAMRDLACQRIECDEIWSFVGSKQKNVPDGKEDEYGDVWTWVAIDADTKLVPSYLVGGRGMQEAHEFMRDLASRLRHRVELSTDGYRPYMTAVRDAFKGNVDHGVIVKLYGKKPDDRGYSPGECIGVDTFPASGNPTAISTSYVERQNLTMRMSMRRFTRLTNGFSKKVENLAAAVSLHFMHYNSCRPHKSLTEAYGPRVTPAMAAGLTDHVWTLHEMIALLEGAESTPVKRGRYAKTREARNSPEDSK